MSIVQLVESESRAHAQRRAAQSQAEVQRLQERERNAQAYAKHPTLLRLLELETLRELGENANARICIGFNKHAPSRVALGKRVVKSQESESWQRTM